MFVRRQCPFYLFLFAGISLMPGCFKDLTATTIVYENSFENNERHLLDVYTWNSTSTAVIARTEPMITQYGGTKLLGKFNNGLVRLALENLPEHTIIRVEFDLYAHDKWANDLWAYSIDGNYQLITGFSNYDTTLQAYPNWKNTGAPLSPAGKNAQDINLPGTCGLLGSLRGTSLYRIVATMPHTSKKLSIDWTDAGNFFNDTCQRSWAIDNIKISTIHN